MVSQSLEDRITRCPRLGHEVNFSYCRKESGNYPCERVVACWQGIFEVEDLLRREMGAKDWEAFKNRAPRDKIATLLDLMEKVRLRQKWPR